MRRLIMTICSVAALGVCLSVSAQHAKFSEPVAQKETRLFEYPTPPEALVTLSDRCNYLVEHFWERCNLKSAFSHRARLADAFRDYVSFFPYASADTVHASIDNLIKEVKREPKNLLTLGEIAENALYGDSAEIFSDEVYLPFAQAVADCRKIPAASRARFEHQARVLANSAAGAKMIDLPLTLADGSKGHLSDIKADNILLFVNDPDCDDCRLARARLAADFNARALIEEGKLAIVSVLPDEPDDEWREGAKSYPANWVVAANPDLDELIDMRHPPVLYMLGADRKILAKNIVVDNVLNVFTLMRR